MFTIKKLVFIFRGIFFMNLFSVGRYKTIFFVLLINCMCIGVFFAGERKKQTGLSYKQARLWMSAGNGYRTFPRHRILRAKFDEDGMRRIRAQEKVQKRNKSTSNSPARQQQNSSQVIPQEQVEIEQPLQQTLPSPNQFYATSEKQRNLRDMTKQLQQDKKNSMDAWKNSMVAPLPKYARGRQDGFNPEINIQNIAPSSYNGRTTRSQSNITQNTYMVWNGCDDYGLSSTNITLSDEFV